MILLHHAAAFSVLANICMNEGLQTLYCTADAIHAQSLRWQEENRYMHPQGTSLHSATVTAMVYNIVDVPQGQQKVAVTARHYVQMSLSRYEEAVSA